MCLARISSKGGHQNWCHPPQKAQNHLWKPKRKLLTRCLSEKTTHLCFLMYLTTASLWPRCSCTWPSSWSPRARNRQLPSPFHGYLEIWHKPKIFLLPPGICFRESPKVPSCLFRLRKSSKPPSMAACLSFLFLLLERKCNHGSNQHCEPATKKLLLPVGCSYFPLHSFLWHLIPCL